MRYRSNRWPSQTQITMQTVSGHQTAYARNISQGGARLHDIDTKAGERMVLVFNEMCFPCWVIWTRDNMAGIRFDRMISPSQVALIRGERQGAHHRQRPLRSFGIDY